MVGKIVGLGICLALALLLCITFGSPQEARQDAKAWYPLEPGDTWTYQKESLLGNEAHPDGERWITKETILSAFPVRELGAIMVTKSTKILNDSPTPGFEPKYQLSKRELPVTHLLVRQNCVYLLDGLDANGASEVQVSGTESVSALDDRTQIRPAYRDALLRGNVPADFCFPVVAGMAWGEVPGTSPTGEFMWRVTGLNADPFGTSGGNTFHLWSYLGSGDTIDRWFEKGIGVVQEVEEHHGAYDEDRRLLLSTTIGGKTQTYQLTPARTTPLSKEDCDGSSWQHFARADGTAFGDMADCIGYLSARDHLH
jgi:hypothetical protein